MLLIFDRIVASFAIVLRHAGYPPKEMARYYIHSFTTSRTLKLPDPTTFVTKTLVMVIFSR